MNKHQEALLYFGAAIYKFSTGILDGKYDYIDHVGAERAMREIKKVFQQAQTDEKKAKRLVTLCFPFFREFAPDLLEGGMQITFKDGSKKTFYANEIMRYG